MIVEKIVVKGGWYLIKGSAVWLHTYISPSLYVPSTYMSLLCVLRFPCPCSLCVLNPDLLTLSLTRRLEFIGTGTHRGDPRFTRMLVGKCVHFVQVLCVCLVSVVAVSALT